MAQIVILLLVAPPCWSFSNRTGGAEDVTGWDYFLSRIHFNLLVIRMSVRDAAQDRFPKKKVGATSLLQPVFMVYRRRSLVVHAIPARAHLLIGAVFFRLARRLSGSSQAWRRKLRRQTNSSVKGGTMLKSTCR